VAFDAVSLTPVAVLDGIAVTNLRTAAVSALAVRHLAPPDAARLVVFGRGPQGAAHVICCCTTARRPIFDGALVADHATVVAIGTHEPDAREVDDVLVGRSSVVVESVAAALRDAGDLLLADTLRRDELIPLAALVRGEQAPVPGRPRLFKSVGMAWEDAVIVDAILAASG